MFLVLAVVWAQSIAFAQEQQPEEQPKSTLKLDTGKEIWEAACVGCHGSDGKGQPYSTLGFETPATFPDFTDCNGSTREMSLQWSSVIHNGGPARAFSQIMPSFGPAEEPALTDDQIKKVIEYARSFCEEDNHWPSGDFNFARPMFTEKAFPEDELVLFTQVNSNGSGFSHNMIIEKRFGAIWNLETRFRGGFEQSPAGTWFGAVGDTSFELKRSMYINNKRGQLLAWGNELLVPTGTPSLGQGNGQTFFESFLSFGQILPHNSYFQGQVGSEAPIFHRHQQPTEVYFRTATGKAFNQDRGFGRSWTPAFEFTGYRGLGPYQKWALDIVPEVQVTLSKRQHMRLGVGIDIPIYNVNVQVPGQAFQVRQKGLVFYLLWDTFDGGLLEGWR